MAGSLAISALAERLRRSSGIAAKSDIASVAKSLGLSGDDVIPVGDDCAAIPDSDGYLLFAIEGFMNELVRDDPWFAGYCGVMVNVSDIACAAQDKCVPNALMGTDRACDLAARSAVAEPATAQYAVECEPLGRSIGELTRGRRALASAANAG